MLKPSKECRWRLFVVNVMALDLSEELVSLPNVFKGSQTGMTLVTQVRRQSIKGLDSVKANAIPA